MSAANSTNQTTAGKVLLLVHAGSTGKVFILQKIKQLGITIVCLNKDIPDFAKPYVDTWIVADVNDHEACTQKVAEYIANNKKPDGVVTFWDECVPLTSKLVDAFDFIGIPHEVSRIIKNKHAFREACLERGLPTPKSKLISKADDVDSIDNGLTYPLVTKPIYGAASAYVVKVSNREELKKAIAYITTSIGNFWLAPEWQNHDILVEEYIDGAEVDIDIILQNGEVRYCSITDNKETNEPYFVETAWSSPSALTGDKQKALVDMATQTLAAFGVRNACVHFEAKIGSRGAFPIEVNMRMGGGQVYLYAQKIWNVDLVESAVRVMFGLPVETSQSKSPKIYLASHRFLAEYTCTVHDITIDPELKNKSYFVEFILGTPQGAVFLAPPEGYDNNIGILTVSGSTSQEAQKNIQEAITFVKMNLEKVTAQQAAR